MTISSLNFKLYSAKNNSVPCTLHYSPHPPSFFADLSTFNCKVLRMSSSLLARRALVASVGTSIFGVTAYFSYQLSSISSSSTDDIDIGTGTSSSEVRSPTSGAANSRQRLSSSLSSPVCKKCSHISDPNRNETFQKNAKMYDMEISREEAVMGVQLLRRALLYFHSNGSVLEVAGGTGRNLEYYPSDS